MDAPPAGSHLVVSVALPDRPGALGAVASRIGALGADITDVIISRRAAGDVEDTFHLDLPAAGDLDVVTLLLDELREVDGVRVVAWRGGSCCR